MNAFSSHIRLLLALILAGLPVPSAAEPIKEPWQSRRVAGNALADRACEGDASAIAEVKRRIEAGYPVTLNNTAWLRDNCEDFKSMSEDEIVANQQRAALAGYPIAIANYGNRLVKGTLGIPQDAALGVAMLENAIEGGHGSAASALARYYTEGKYLPRDTKKARAYLEIAEAEGYSPETLEKRAEALARVEAELSDQVGSAPGSEQYAALAVSTVDGGFGFAHDYATEKAARTRALEECNSRGGEDCSVKMVGRGKGCMAYHSAGGSATARGWSIGATSSAVQTRAAKECRLRNDNQPCGNSAWVCNDRTEAPLTTVFEAPMPSAAPAAGTVQCRFYLGFRCKLPGNNARTVFAYESFRNGETFPVVARDCQRFYDDGATLIYYNNGQYARDFVSPSLKGAAKTRAYGLIEKMKSYVYGKYPGCSTDGITIKLAIENPKRGQKTRYNSNKSRMNFDNGTPRYHYVTLE